jgi:hypothetical protein
VLSGQGHRAPWSNGGIVITRGKPKECGQKPVHVAFRKRHPGLNNTSIISCFFLCMRVLFNDASKCLHYTTPN